MTQPLRDERGRFIPRAEWQPGWEERLPAPKHAPRPRLHAIVQFAAGLWAVGFLLYMLPATLIEQNWLGSAGLVIGFGLILAAIWGDRW